MSSQYRHLPKPSQTNTMRTRAPARPAWRVAVLPTTLITRTTTTTATVTCPLRAATRSTYRTARPLATHLILRCPRQHMSRVRLVPFQAPTPTTSHSIRVSWRESETDEFLQCSNKNAQFLFAESYLNLSAPIKAEPGEGKTGTCSWVIN